MPDVTVGDYIQAVVSFRYANGVTGLNRFGYVVVGNGSVDYTDAVVEIADALGAGYQQWLPVCSQAVTFETVECSLVAYSYAERQWRVVSKMGLAVLDRQGGSTSEPLPSTVTASITLTSFLARVRGRKSLPGLTDAIVDQDMLVDTAINRLAQAATMWRAHVTLTTGLYAKWVLLQRVGGHTNISGIKISRIVGSQDTRDRRRHL